MSIRLGQNRFDELWGRISQFAIIYIFGSCWFWRLVLGCHLDCQWRPARIILIKHDGWCSWRERQMAEAASAAQFAVWSQRWTCSRRSIWMTLTWCWLFINFCRTLIDKNLNQQVSRWSTWDFLVHSSSVFALTASDKAFSPVFLK